MDQAGYGTRTSGAAPVPGNAWFPSKPQTTAGRTDGRQVTNSNKSVRSFIFSGDSADKTDRGYLQNF